ncbi:hypothetical protein [Bosea sp. BIWAKO-01]|uniref:DUF7696 family protein n=1 Tax=Bosea sp. BIWAKO-01 TaxID=506668 RepID=UPI000853ADB7|nr:hypothetical protein [Bosea sp. BIWAKO-01]GAU84706.1 hypothetical protein BIWAKO_04643 [Bosea sp. BIWAKO-01]
MSASAPRYSWSHLAGREVSTSSEAWRHECEIEYLLAMPEQQRAEFLDGIPGAIDRESRGVKGVRGEAAVAALKEAIERLRQIKTRG